MLNKNLTPNDKELLEVIFKYGGYTRVKHLEFLYPDISERAYSYKLDRLVEVGCLTKRRYINNSKREPVTYQVTQAGCHLCGNINSTFRRKRPIEYAYRALLRNLFFLQIHKELEGRVICNLNDRRALFEGVGFSPYFFPKKVNKEKATDEEVAIVQFEEFILNFRFKEGKKLCYDGKVLYEDGHDSIVIVHVDQPHIEIQKQLVTVVNRYVNMVNQHISKGIGFNMNFLIVVDSDNRYKMYSEVIKKFLSGAKYQEKISDMLLKLYAVYYEKLEKKDSAYAEKHRKIEQEFSGNQLRNSFIDRAKSFKISDKVRLQFVTEQLKLKRYSFLSDSIYNTMKENESDVEAGRKKVEELFDMAAYLEFSNIVYLGDNAEKSRYEIKIFKTAMCIYGE